MAGARLLLGEVKVVGKGGVGEEEEGEGSMGAEERVQEVKAGLGVLEAVQHLWGMAGEHKSIRCLYPLMPGNRACSARSLCLTACKTSQKWCSLCLLSFTCLICSMLHALQLLHTVVPEPLPVYQGSTRRPVKRGKQGVGPQKRAKMQVYCRY
jgi:hypothetical protein